MKNAAHVGQRYSRFRTRVQSSTRIPDWTFNEVFYTGSTTARVSYAGTVLPHRETMADVVTPGFQALVAKGSIINNPCTASKVSYTASAATITDNYYTRSSAAWASTVVQAGIVPGFHCPSLYPSLPSLVAPSDFGGAAVNQAFADAKVACHQALVDLGEMRETINLLASPLNKAAGALVALKRALANGKHRKRPNRKQRSKILSGLKRTGWPGKVLGQASEVWLEYRYGWQPLMFSIADACDAIRRYEQSVRKTGRGRQSWSHEDSATVSSFYNPLNVPVPSAHDQHTVSRIYKKEWRATCIAQVDYTFSSAHGLQLTDLPSAGYELIPLSFVLDWFVGVGDWISAVMPQPGVHILGSCLVERTQLDLVYTSQFSAASDQSGSGTSLKRYTRSGGQSIYSVTEQTTSRAIGVSPTIFPQFKAEPLSNLKHVLDALALGCQALGAGVRRVR